MEKGCFKEKRTRRKEQRSEGRLEGKAVQVRGCPCTWEVRELERASVSSLLFLGLLKSAILTGSELPRFT